MADGLQLLDIPQANIAEIDEDQFMYIVTPSGERYRATLTDVVSKMQQLNNCICMHEHSQVITSAELLA